MRPPAPTRAFWSESRYCPDCKQHRPWFFFHKFNTGGKCKTCYRAYQRKQKAAYFKNNPEQLAKMRARYLAHSRKRPRELTRARTSLYKLRKRNPKLVPRWVTIESLLPIYAEAVRLEQENPGYLYIVRHIYPLGNIKDVCGLHTIDNLRLVRHKKPKEKGFCPSVLSSPRSKSSS